MTSTLPVIPAVVLALFVPGRPAPQGSMKAVISRSTGRAMMKKDNEGRQNSWRRLVAQHAAQVHVGELLDGPLAVRLEFVMPRPVATPKRRATPPAVKKPDIDKLSRAVLDALTGVAWRDDSQITDLRASKRLAELDEQPGVHISLTADVKELSA
jgi:crossover junction endodeoxyribonuclease RusA